METFSSAQLVQFVKMLDQELRNPAQLIVIGGAAAALRYAARRNTTDIDTFNTIPPDVERAVRVTQQKSRLGIVVSKASVADPPWNFEDRLERLDDLGLVKLEILVPERHDLALMKTLRGYAHDVEVLQEMHRAHPFDLDTLVSRFKSEMGQAVTDHRIFRINFVVLVERTFGKDIAARVREILSVMPAGAIGGWVAEVQDHP